MLWRAAGADDKAIDLLRARARTAPEEADTQVRLAALLVKSHRFADAAGVLERLMHAPASPALRTQAAGDWLEAATAAGSVDDLIRRERGRLDAGAGDREDLSLLVNALLQQQDVAAAVRAIEQSPLLDPAERLRRLSVVYLRRNDLDAAAGVLHRLVDADPAAADITLERLAVVELKRGHVADATATIETLRARVGDEPASLSVMAGIEARLGRAREAADTYRRVVASRPSDADGWLLWATAAAKAGDPVAARRRLQLLCAETADDSVLAAAVDGLINLAADRSVLHAARRAVILRLADRPGALVLYPVAADLATELEDVPGLLHVTTASIAVDSDGRTQKLRELVELAGAHGGLDLAIDASRSLLMSGEALPPGLFLQLGEPLLVAGRPADAAGAFERAAEAGDPAEVGLQAADLLEKYGYTAEALRTLAPLVARLRPDSAVFERVARLHETLGHAKEALDAYLSALSLSAVVVDATRADMSGVDPSSRAEVDLLRQLSGAIVSARSPADVERLLAVLDALVRNAVKLSQAAEAVPPRRVTVLATAARRAAMYFGQPHRADATDALILKRWSNAKDFRDHALNARFAQGLIQNAIDFARANPGETDGRVERCRSLMSRTATTRVSESEERLSFSGTDVEFLPLMIIQGATEAARANLARAVSAQLATQPTIETAVTTTTATTRADAPPAKYRLLLRAAAALGEVDQVSAIALRWLATALAMPDADRVRGECLDCVKTSWPLLNSAGRRRLVAGLINAASIAKNTGTRSFLAGTVLPLARANGDWPANGPELAKLATGLETGQADSVLNNVGRIFALLPDADRPAYLRAINDALPRDRRLAMLMKVLDDSTDRLDSATRAVLIDLADHAPPGQHAVWTGWYYNDGQPDVLRAVAAAAFRSAVEDDPVGLTRVERLTAIAAAFANAGDASEANRHAAAAVDAWFVGERTSGRDSAAISSPPLERLPLLRVATAAMSLEGRKAMLAASGRVGLENGESPFRSTLRALLLEGVGDRNAALQTLRDGIRRDPNHPLLVQAYLERLRDDGRRAELLSLRMTSSGSAADQFAVAHRLQDLYRWREARAAFAAGAEAPDFAASAARGDLAALAMDLRVFLQAIRARPTRVPQVYLPDSDVSDRRKRPSDTQPPGLLLDVATWPDATDAVLRTLHLFASEVAHGTDESDAYLARVLVASVRSRDDVGRVVEHFRAIAASGTLSPADRRAISMLACEPDRSVPLDLLAKLWPAALADQTGRELDRLSWALGRQQSPNALAARAWAMTSPSLFAEDARFDPHRLPTTPLELMPDAKSVTALASLADDDLRQAEQRTAALARSGQIRRAAFGLRLVQARLAAERGDIAAYRDALLRTLHDWAWRTTSPRPAVVFDASEGILDVRDALPTHLTDGPQRAAALAVVKTCLLEAATRWPSSTEWPRQLADIGVWSLRHGDRRFAEECLTAGNGLASRKDSGGGQSLADLANLLGQDALATQIEVQLLRDRCLSSDRIEPLVTRLLGDPSAVARTLVSDAATYCQEPRLKALAKSLEAKQKANR